MQRRRQRTRWTIALAATATVPIAAITLTPGIHADTLSSSDDIEICCVDADVYGPDLVADHGEHVAITNTGTDTVDVSGYYVIDAANNRLDVGSGYTIPPGGELRIYTGPGSNSATSYYNNHGSNVLNNNGDSLDLYTDDDQLIDQYQYSGTW